MPGHLERVRKHQILWYSLRVKTALGTICLLATQGCLEAKYADTDLNAVDASEYDSEVQVEQIAGAACEMAETAWPLRRSTNSDWDAQAVFEAWQWHTGPWGVAVADFDADGFHDVYLPQIGPSQLYRNDGTGEMLDVSHTHLPTVDGVGIAATAVDLDGDNDLDIVESGLGHVWLLINDGEGRFTLGDEMALDDATIYFGSAWADMDGDGDLDGIVPALPSSVPSLEEIEANDFLAGAPDVLLENTPDGLVDASHRLPDTNDGYTFISAWQDMEGDAQPEILVMNDNFFAGRSNRLWKSNGDTFDDVSVKYGLDQSMGSMGLGITDGNGDRLPDLLISGWRELVYLVSDAATGVYISSAVAEGFAPLDESTQWIAWAVEYADLDNSGDEEALVTYGHGEFFTELSTPVDQADALFVRTGSAVRDAGSQWGFGDQTFGRGMTVADLNRDGHPDVIRRPVFSVGTIDMPRCTGAAWTVVEPRQSTGNRRAIGARIQVEASGQQWVRWVRAGGTGLSGGGPPEAHIGLGTADRIDRLVIQWPDGVETVLTDLPTHHRLIITR